MQSHELVWKHRMLLQHAPDEGVAQGAGHGLGVHTPFAKNCPGSGQFCALDGMQLPRVSQHAPSEPHGMNGPQIAPKVTVPPA